MLGKWNLNANIETIFLKKKINIFQRKIDGLDEIFHLQGFIIEFVNMVKVQLIH